MISLFIKVLPYFFLAYFIIRYFQEPVFLLGIPFLMFFRFSIFFQYVKIFSIPGRFGSEVLLLVWLIFVWLIISIKSKNLRERTGEKKLSEYEFNLLDYIIASLMVISLIGLVFVLNENYIVQNVLVEFITLLSLFLGYFIVKDIARNTKLHVLSEFLFSIVVINSIASLLYFIHQGLHITLYTSGSSADEYLEDFFQGEVITRTFWFMPVLWFFSISYLLVFKKSKSFAFISLMSINLLAIFISYTRSFLIISILIIVAYFLLSGFKKRDIVYIVKNLIIVGITGVFLFIGISNFLPAKTNYFISRFRELDKNSSDAAESNNLIYRFQNTQDVISRIDQDKLIVGHGPITEIQMPYVAIMRLTTSDMAWTGVVFRWGYLGLALFSLLFIGSIVKSYLLFIRTEGLVSQLALLCLLTIFAQLIECFTSWTFMSPNRFAMGLWYFGVFSAISLTNKKQAYSITIEQ